MLRHIKIIFVIVLIGLPAIAFGYDTNELNDAYNKIKFPKLDIEQVNFIKETIVKHQNLNIILDSGQIAFFQPIVLDSTQIYFGAYFKGRGKIQFSPPVTMERDQLNRFFSSDSLNRYFDEIYLLFSPEIYEQLKTSAFLDPAANSYSFDNNTIKDKYKEINRTAAFNFSFDLLRSITYPVGRPFLFASTDPENTKLIFYKYDPYLREEVQLLKYFWEPGNSYMEEIISYSQYNLDESYLNLNGRNKEQLETIHFDIVASIDKKGKYTGQTTVTYEVLKGPLQLLEVNLSPTMLIDSILDNNNKNVNYKRGKLAVSFKNYGTWNVDLLLNDTYKYQDSLQLTFFLNGEIAETNLGEYYVFAGASWYPRYGHRHRATFDMTFQTPEQYTFTTCGENISTKKGRDFLKTEWKVISPASNISFNIGNLKKYDFKEKDVPPVEIYFSKNIHEEISTYLAEELIAIGKNMEKQIAEDIQNSIRVFSHYFGPYPYEKIQVSEILPHHAEAFPAFVHLRFDTWVNTDKWGNERMLRSHEVAHQWWGVGVGYETYHDQWLSEGLSTYSSLMYIQAVEGIDLFMDKLQDFRTDIFTARKFLLSSGEESGPIAMGYRTSSSETEGDYGLIIYKKGAYVIHMLRNLLIDLKTMNEDMFLAMMREFYGTNRGKSITTRNFQTIAEKYTGLKLDWFFNQWIYNNYLPEVKFEYDYTQEKDRTFTAHCRVITKGVPDDFKMYYPLEVKINKDSKAYVRILVEGTDFKFDLPGLPQKPSKLILNPFESVLAKIKQ